MSPQAQVGPQSNEQVLLFSPHWGWQMPSPQKTLGGQAPQSWHVLGLSPHWGSQRPLPQKQPWPQSAGQLCWFSLQAGSHFPSPHAHAIPQSGAHVTELSPHASSHVPLPQAHIEPPLPPLPPLPPTPWFGGSGSIVDRLQPAPSATSHRTAHSSARERKEQAEEDRNIMKHPGR